jgi:hypothetical protein
VGFLIVRLVQRNFGQSFLVEAHEHRVDSDAIQPSGERRIAAKHGQLPEHLHKGILGQIFRLCRVIGQPQADREDPPSFPFRGYCLLEL